MLLLEESKGKVTYLDREKYRYNWNTDDIYVYILIGRYLYSRGKSLTQTLKRKVSA